jgi:hypothetical protein
LVLSGVRPETGLRWFNHKPATRPELLVEPLNRPIRIQPFTHWILRRGRRWIHLYTFRGMSFAMGRGPVGRRVAERLIYLNLGLVVLKQAEADRGKFVGRSAQGRRRCLSARVNVAEIRES